MIFFLVGCSSDESPDESADQRGDPILGLDGNPVSGTATRSADGWASLPYWVYVTMYGSTPGAQVAVRVRVDAGYIEEVHPFKPPNTEHLNWESEGQGTYAMAETAKMIIEANSFEVDYVSGSTYSSLAVINAGKDALEAIIAGEVD